MLFTIRAEQMQALGAVRLEKLREGILVELAGRAPAWTQAHAEEVRRDWVRRAVDVALARKLESEDALLAWVETTTLLGLDFEHARQSAWTRGYLTDPDITAMDDRVLRLCAEARRRRAVAEKNARIRKEFARDD